LKKSWTNWDRWKLNPKRDWTGEAKKRAALEAVKHVKDGFTVGLGSGSTAAHAILELGNRIRKEKLQISAVPTSYQAFTLAVQNGISITTLEEHRKLDLTIDGTDQISSDLDLIKGMGGALTREKIVATASKRLIIVADENKKVRTLGENDHPVPIEVVPFAASLVTRRIREMHGRPVIREGKGKVGPVVTDNGNIIIDAHFGPIGKPAELHSSLKQLTGVVETGLFIKIADIAYIGTTSTVEKLVRK
jgi:ribose 5-phosphate isomerase A